MRSHDTTMTEEDKKRIEKHHQAVDHAQREKNEAERKTRENEKILHLSQEKVQLQEINEAEREALPEVAAKILAPDMWKDYSRMVRMLIIHALYRIPSSPTVPYTLIPPFTLIP